ncbi:MAG: tRNA pseudouridine(38-40) synthase TruA [Deltaproteobacteria bacterium]|nr:tRNA pseudouridine(38-40) synthase TruA [Deltaproteobacteria bacterium]
MVRTPQPPRRILLTVAYDGTNFSGWQVQPNVRTVQGELEAAVSEMEGRRVRVRGAGRTDAGVHALGQAATFTTSGSIPPMGYLKGLVSLLPDDMAVTAIRQVPDHFVIQTWPVIKLYRYTFYESVFRDPFLERYAIRTHVHLDVDSMNRAAQYLLGAHDFSSFRAADCERKTAVRRIDQLTVTRSSNLVTLDVMGPGFLKNMVRIVAGTLLQVGLGRWPATRIADILEARDRTKGGPTARAKGLCLVWVRYRDIEPAVPPGNWLDPTWPMILGPAAGAAPEPAPILDFTTKSATWDDEPTADPPDAPAGKRDDVSDGDPTGPRAGEHESGPTGKPPGTGNEQP